MTPAEITALVTALGGGIILRDGIGWLARSLTGREQKRRDDAQRAWEAYDGEAKRRRKVERFAVQLETMLIRADCVDQKEIPSWPASGQPGPNEVEKR